MDIRFYVFAALNHQIQVEDVTAGEEINPYLGCSLSTGLKRKITKDMTNTPQLLRVPGATPRRQSAADLEAKGSAVKILFKGNYEERRKFGVVDIFDTLGFAVSTINTNTICSYLSFVMRLSS
jgi:hypothetical protein